MAFLGIDLKENGSHRVQTTGILEIHSVEKKVTVPTTMRSKRCNVESDFEIELENSKLKFPLPFKKRLPK